MILVPSRFFHEYFLVEPYTASEGSGEVVMRFLGWMVTILVS